MVPVIFLYQKTTFSHEVNHVQVFVWVRFFEARFVGFRSSQIESWKKKKKQVHMSSSRFVPARGLLTSNHFFRLLFPGPISVCSFACISTSHLMSAGKNVLSPTKLVQTLYRKGPFGRLTTSSPCNVVPLFELPVENNKHPNFEWRGGGGLWIEKNCLNAEVYIYVTLKYNWLVPLAGSLIKEML